VTYSKSEQFPNAFNIDSVNIVADTALYVGDTINLQIKFRSFVEASGYYELETSGGFRVLQDNELYEEVKDTLTFDTNQVTKNYQIIVDSITTSEFIFRTVITDELIGVNNFERLQFQAEPNGNRIDFPVYQVDGCVINEQVNPNDQTDDLCQTFTFIQPTNPSIGTKREIHINGSVTYNDIYNSQGDSKSTYTDVWLFFRKIGGQPGILIHPSPFVGNKPVEGEHYTKCDDDGDFSFDFEYDLDSLKNGEENATFDVIIMVSKENEALWLESPSNHNRVNSLTNLYRTFNSPETMHVRFFKNDFGVKSNYDPNSSANQNGNHQFTMTFKLKEDDGSIFRHITLSREFLKEFYDEETFEDLGMNQIHLINIKGNWCDNSSAAFSSCLNWINGDYIWINGYSNAASINCAHEYGHYFNKYNSRFSSTLFSTTCNEGFALFYGWIYRQWLNNQYGDGIEAFIDNCELGPYISFQNANRINGQWVDDIEDYSNRFGNITKTRTDVNMSKFACLLSNIYDGTDYNLYSFSQYQGKDNDDINGLRLELFNYFYSRKNSTPTNDYNQIYIAIKSFLNDIILSESIDALYNFMDFDQDRTLNTLYALNINMKSPNLFFEINSFSGNTVSFKWGSSKSYNFNNFPLEDIDIWGNRKTTYITSNFNNTELGVRHYKKLFGQNWLNPVIVQNYPSATFTDPLVVENEITYKVATFNIAGNSYIPYYFHFPFKIGVNESDNSRIVSEISVSNNEASMIVNCDIDVEISVYDLLGKILLLKKQEYKCKKGINKILLSDLGYHNCQFYIIQFTFQSLDNSEFSKSIKIIKGE
jgi:hypothetical protein